MRIAWTVAAALVALATPAVAQSLRDQLTQASFLDRDKATALRRVEGVLASVKDDDTPDAMVLRATALGYRAKLTGSRSDLAGARKSYETVVGAQPRNAEALLGLGAWHMSVIGKAGALLGRVFGASRSKGEAALDRAVALGGDRALYPGLAALFRLRDDPTGTRGRQLAEQAARAAAPTQLDRIVQRSSNAVLAQARAGKSAEARALAQRLLPLGAIPGVN